METDDVSSPCDESFSKQILISGSWGEKPRVGANCEVLITEVLYNSETPISHSVYFVDTFNGVMTLGNGDSAADHVLEKVVMTMFPGEQSWVSITFRSGTVTCHVHLKNVFNNTLIFELSDEKKFQMAESFKKRGVELYQAQRIVDAFRKFSLAFKMLLCIHPVVECDSGMFKRRADVEELLATSYNNMAMCHLVNENYMHVINLCGKVLEIQPKNVKALYRRSSAYMQLQQYESAKLDLLSILSLDSGNIAAKEKLKDLMTKTKDMDDKYNLLVKKMFS